MQKVLDSSTKYQLYMQFEKNKELLEKASQDDETSAGQLIGQAESRLMDLSIQSKAVKEAVNLSEGIDEYLEERMNNPVIYSGLTTGFEIMDRRIDGLVPGTLHVVCARPKHGKSTFLSCMAAYVAYSTNIPVLYIDTEMTFGEWRPRILSMLSKVDERKVKKGGYSDQEYYNLKQAAEIIKKGKLFHEFMPGYEVDKLISVYKKYKHKENIGLGIFDYIKAPSKADFKSKKEYQIIGDVVSALKDLAGELNIPVMAANQINRQQDIADSDRVLRYADVIMFFKLRTMEELQNVHPFEKDYGTHKLVITDSRRGGTTPEEGIGFTFLKRILYMSESKRQLVDYDSREFLEKEELNFDDSDSMSKQKVDEVENIELTEEDYGDIKRAF
jgi:replicative DNA helicase